MESNHRCCANCSCRRAWLETNYLKCDTSSICSHSHPEAPVHQKIFVEAGHNKTKCNQCKKTIQQIRTLLDDIIAAKEINATLTNCKCCKRIIKFKQCQKCNAHKLITCQDERTKVKTLTEWLLKLKYLLTTILHSSHSICQHSSNTDTDLESILKEIRKPICARKPVIEYFPDIGEHQLLTQSISASKDLLDILLNRIEPESDETTLVISDTDSSSSSSSCHESCICKLLKNKMPFEPKVESTIEVNIDINPKVLTGESSIEEKGKKTKNMEKSKISVKNLHKKSAQDLHLKNMLKEKAASERRKENMKNNIPQAVKSYDRGKDEMQKLVDKQLADALASQKVAQETTSSTYVECDMIESPKYIVKSTCLVPYDSLSKDNEHEELYTKRQFLFESSVGSKTTTTFKSDASAPAGDPKRKKKAPGIINYRLSDRTFINNGWTELPQEKTMRRMNLYKMKPVDPEKNWFERYKHKRTLYYDTGEPLADINEEEGHAVMFYRNGATALDYYFHRDIKDGCRCTVYSREDLDSNKPSVRTTLAMFDFFGNGVIYDTNGNTRLKYNQSEGIVIDSKIAFPSRWKWHSLNEPPILKMLRVDSCLEPKDPVIIKLGRGSASYVNPSKTTPLPPDSPELVMQQLEAEMMVKYKLKSNFKLLVTTPKVAKLSECFTLRISGQTSIVLTYRSKSTALKLNLGMNLNSKKIVGFDMCEADEVELLYPKNGCFE